MTTVVVQRGHYPRTRGATGAPGEQQFAVSTAARLKPKLEALGLKVRVVNADISPADYRGDIFVAIHYDSGASSASGASVGYQSTEGRRLASLWKKHYQREGWTRGFRDDNYTANLAQYYGVANAIRQGNRAAIITESGFHSNAGDKALLSPERTAESIKNAIAEYLGIPTERDDDMELTDKVNLKGLDASKIRGGQESVTVNGALADASTAKQAYDKVVTLEKKVNEILKIVKEMSK